MGISEIERGEVASTQSWGAVKHGLDPKWVGGICARLEMGDWFNTVGWWNNYIKDNVIQVSEELQMWEGIKLDES